MSNPFEDKPNVPNLNEDYNDPNLNEVHVRLRDKEATHLAEIRKTYRLALAELLKKNPVLADNMTAAQRQNLENMSRHQMLHYLIQYGFKHKNYLGRLIARMALEHTTDLDIYEEKNSIDITGDEYSKRIYNQNYIDFMSAPNPVVDEFPDKKTKRKDRGK